MIKAVIVDVDDTLCMTEEACFLLENKTLKAMGRPPMSREIHRQTWGGLIDEVITLRSPGIDVTEFKKIYLPLIQQAMRSGEFETIPDENFVALDLLITQGKDILILTNRAHEEVSHMLEPDHLLASRVKAFYHKGNNPHHKPDPKTFNMALREHNLQPDQCAYVGDSLMDAEAAHGAGVHFIACLENGIRKPEDFNDFTVDTFIQKFPEVVKAVNELDQAEATP